MSLGKVLELNALAERLATLRAEGRRVVHCHGVFDPLHVGHMRYFNAGAKHGGRFVSTITPDPLFDKGTAIGKSSKEPMVAVKRSNTETFAGGILAVGNHVANFSDNVSMVTQLGGRDSYADFIAHALSPKIQATYLRRMDSPTIVKRR